MASTEDEVKDSINIIMEVVYEERKKEKLKHDVDCMSQLLWSLLDECKGRPKSLPEKIKQHFKDIYWSLRLHLEFHFGRDAVDLENLRKVGENLGLDTQCQPGVECAIDPGSKLLEILSSMNDHCGRKLGTKEHADEVLEMAKSWLMRFLKGTKGRTGKPRRNTFRPRVLAKISRGINEQKKTYAVGSSLAVSHFLRPLYFHDRISHFKQLLKRAVIYNEPLETRAEENVKWEFNAFGGNGYEEQKEPCKTCKYMFGNLQSFEGESDKFQFSSAQCAEYCPVNQLLPPDPKTTPPGDEITQELDTALAQFHEKCLFLFKNFGKIAQMCKEASDSKDIEKIRKAYEEHVKKRVHIFGIKPELNDSLRPLGGQFLCSSG